MAVIRVKCEKCNNEQDTLVEGLKHGVCYGDTVDNLTECEECGHHELTRVFEDAPVARHGSWSCW